MGLNKKVRVFAAYQIGIGPNAKMVGDESKNKFEVTFSVTSKMIREIEEILAKRHSGEIEQGEVVVVHHFQLMSGF